MHYLNATTPLGQNHYYCMNTGALVHTHIRLHVTVHGGAHVHRLTYFKEIMAMTGRECYMLCLDDTYISYSS